MLKIPKLTLVLNVGLDYSRCQYLNNLTFLPEGSLEIQGVFKVSQNSEVDAGTKATVLHGQGTIKLAAGDFFYGEPYRGSVNYLNQNNGFYQSNDTRTGTLSCNYRFGKNVAASRKRSTADEEESKRAQ
jgi:hypothetical protein